MVKIGAPFFALTRADSGQQRYLDANRDTTYAGDNLKGLRHSYTDRAIALQAARTEWNRLQRCIATLRYLLAKGRPEPTPEQAYCLTGIKARNHLLGDNIHHSFTTNSYTMPLDLESQLLDGDDIANLADQGAGYTGVLAWYRDEKTGQQKRITEGDQANPKRLTHLYANKASAAGSKAGVAKAYFR